MRQRITLAVISFLMLAWVLAACGSPAPAPAEPKEAAPAEPAAETSAETSAEPEITVMDPFARASIPNGAAYMTLMNQGGSDDALVSAETGVAQTVELHETTIDENEVMRMSPVEKIGPGRWLGGVGAGGPARDALGYPRRFGRGRYVRSNAQL